MKKRLSTIFMMLASTVGVNLVNAQCTLDVLGDTLICPNDSITLTAVANSTQLGTTLAGGNNHRGNMFDITAINTITITSFDAHPMGNTDYEIYYKTGTYAGSENTAGNWTLVGGATGIIAQPSGTATPIPIPVNVTIPAGQTYAFYVTSTNTSVSQNYTDGTSAGAVYASDANLQFREGVGIEYPFSGSPFSPRIWNGTIHYSPTTTNTYLWSTGETTSSIVVAPTMLSTYSVDVTASGCNTLTDSITVDVSNIETFDLGMNDTLCVGDTAVFDFNQFNGAITWHDASTNMVYNATVSETVSFQLVDIAGCVKNDTVEVTFQTNPMVNLGVDSTICYNDTITLNAGAGNYQYLWSTNETSQSIEVYHDTTVSVAVSDVYGCMTVDTIEFTTYVRPTLIDSMIPALCNEAQNGSVSVTIQNNPSAYSISWENGDTTFVRDSLYAAVYTYTVLDSNNCAYYGSIAVTEPSPLSLSHVVTNETVTGNGAIDLSVTGGTAGYTYNWDNSETTEDIDSLTGGVYTVIVTDANGCQETVSITVNNTVGIDGVTLLDFNVYPNPSNGVITVASPQNNAMLQLFNNVGQVVVTEVIETQQAILDFSSLQKGVYYLKLTANESTGIRAIIIE